jgi:hypothetical protein
MPSDDADLHCPDGGKFYACTSGSLFLGCCKSNPCGSGCRDDDLTAASFNATYSGSFPDQFCPTGAFYTCSKTDPPFLGCCKSDACQRGDCAIDDLVAASLLDASEASDFPTSSTSSSASHSATSSSSTFTHSSISTSTSTSTIASASARSDASVLSEPGLSRGAIAGIAGGGFIALLAIVAVVVALCTRRDKRTLPLEKQNFVVVQRTDPEDDAFYTAPEAQAKLAAPTIRLNEPSKG